MENALERAVLVARNQSPRLKHLPAEIQELHKNRFQERIQPPATLKEVERKHILNVYKSCAEDKVKAAKFLGIGLKTLYRKLDQYGIS